jgi:hypothetical protein
LRLDTVHVHLILRFDRHEHPRLRRMKIHVAWAIPVPAVGRDLVLIRENAVLVVEHHQRAGVFGSLRRAFVAARDQHNMAPVRRHAHLMGVDACVHRPLRHLFPRGEIVVHAIHAQRARVVERHQNVLRFVVKGHVNRPKRQAHRIANLTERTRGGIDCEGRHVVLCASLRIAGRGVA